MLNQTGGVISAIDIANRERFDEFLECEVMPVGEVGMQDNAFCATINECACTDFSARGLSQEIDSNRYGRSPSITRRRRRYRNRVNRYKGFKFLDSEEPLICPLNTKSPNRQCGYGTF